MKKFFTFLITALTLFLLPPGHSLSQTLQDESLLKSTLQSTETGINEFESILNEYYEIVDKIACYRYQEVPQELIDEAAKKITRIHEIYRNLSEEEKKAARDLLIKNITYIAPARIGGYSGEVREKANTEKAILLIYGTTDDILGKCDFFVLYDCIHRFSPYYPILIHTVKKITGSPNVIVFTERLGRRFPPLEKRISDLIKKDKICVIKYFCAGIHATGCQGQINCYNVAPVELEKRFYGDGRTMFEMTFWLIKELEPRRILK